MRLYKFLILAACVIFAGCSTTTPTAQLNGTNAAGGEVVYGVSNTDNPVSGKDFQFISTQDVDYLASKKVNFIRLLFSWEALQPQLNQPLSTGQYATIMKATVDYITSKGITVMIEPHGGNTANFARYKGNVVGSTAVPNSAFQDFWNRVATLYVSNANVVYGLSNEPNNMGTVQWFSAAQAAINGIRVAGSNQMIMVPGNDYTASVTWTSNWYDTASPQVSNATAWLTLKDPVNNLVASVHTYFDANVSGSANDIVSATVGVDRLTDIVAWARTNKVKLHVSEYGVSETNSLAQPATTNLLNYIKTNSDVIIGSSWWTYGPPSWWGSYAFTLCPTNNYATDNVKMAWLTPYFTGQTVQTTIPKVVDASVVEASVDSGQVVDASVDAGFDSGKDASVVVDAGVVLFDAGLDASVDAGKPSLVYSDKVFYTIPGSYCKDFTLANNSSVPLSWTSMQLNMRGGTINTKNGALDLWNVSVSAPTGVITVKPIAIYKTIAPGKSLTFGFCSSYGSLNWTATQVVGSLVQP